MNKVTYMLSLSAVFGCATQACAFLAQGRHAHVGACMKDTAQKAALPKCHANLLLWRPLQNGQPDSLLPVTLNILADHWCRGDLGHLKWTFL